jgi:hypothetical protein
MLDNPRIPKIDPLNVIGSLDGPRLSRHRPLENLTAAATPSLTLDSPRKY